MVQPVNYMAAMPQIDLSQSFAGLGNALGQYGEYQKQQKAEQAAAELKAQYANDVQAYFAKPSASGLAQLTAKYPGQREAFKDIGDRMTAEQKAVELQVMAQAFYAITSGKPEAAKQLVDQQIEGMKNGGLDVTKLEMLRSRLDDDPAQVAGLVGLIGSSIDPDAWGKMMGEKRAQELQPGLVRKGAAEAGAAESEATVKAVKAKFAESDAALELEKKGWDIKKLQADIDIDRQNARIAAMNAAANREANAIKRQELRLKVDEAIAKRDEIARGKIAEVESANSNIDNMLNTIDRVMSNPSLKDVVGSFEGRMPAAASMLDDQESDAIALLDTLGSQAFLAQIPNIKGMGALSNAEGEKLQSALQNLSRAQSEKQLTASLKEAQRLMIKARKNVADRYGVKQSVPDTPSVVPSSSEVDALLKKYGGG